MKKKTLAICIGVFLMVTSVTAKELFDHSTFLTRDSMLNETLAADIETDLGNISPNNRNNTPPVFGIPSPENKSFNNPLSYIWNIPINDTDGDRFNWTIECNNGQKNNQSGDDNGSKPINLSNLAYSTTYTIWVNATDYTGSGQYNRQWYIFTTKVSLPPVFGMPTPTNGSTNQPLSFTWSIPISDPEGDGFDWWIECSNGQFANGNGASNGTKSLDLSGLAYASTYKVWVNATDSDGSNQYTRGWYNFTTKINLPPVFGIPSPENESIDNQLNFDWNINISDPEGDSFNWMIQCSNGDSANLDGGLNGTKSLSLSNLTYSTTYTIWVNATDPDGSGQYTKRWYTFTTKEQNSPPVFGQPMPANNSINQPLSLTWSIPISDPEGNAFSWSIQCSNEQTSSGTGQTNGTKPLALSGLTYVTKYKIWVNATDPTGSNQNSSRWYTFTTKANLPPVFGSPTPTNRSTPLTLSLTWSIPINDPEGNPFSWTIQCSNGANNSGTDASNGTKSLALSGLVYSTTYTVWVNATDSNGSGLYIQKWYIFTPVSGSGGGGGGIPPTENQKPVADLSAGEPYQGFVNEKIFFDGSFSYDPDGSIVEWFWDFGDNTNTSGRKVNHTYSKAAAYLVILRVTDDKGATHIDATTCVIKPQNRSPTKPTISGPTSGTKNTVYTYIAWSTDADNDSLQYTFHWGDTTFQSSGFVPPATSYSINHSWAAAGRYSVTVTVTDNQTENSSKIIVYIDAVQTRGAGYLLDYDADGFYDAFYSDETRQTLAVQMQDDSYFIDKDGDGRWDYVYNETKGLTSYQDPQQTLGYEIGVAFVAIAFALLLRKKSKNQR